jgi:hypothetical protein
MAASGAKKAANTQAQAARDAQASQERMFERQIGLQEPFRQAGMTAQDEIMYLLGLGDKGTAGGAADWNQYLTANPDVMQAYSAGGVDKGQFPTPQSFAQWHYQNYGQNEGRAVPTAPARAGGDEFGSMAKPFGMDQFEQDPGYAFRQAEGMKALERSAAARGNLLSGSTMKGIQRFGQDLASQEYGNAFNRYQIERTARLNPLQSLMGSGQSAANTMTSAAGNFGQSSANNIMNAGQARASGYVGSGNALAGALGSIGQAAVQAPYLQAQTNYLNTMANANQTANIARLTPSAANTIASNQGIF